MNALRVYRERHGLSHEQLAAELSNRLGRPITGLGVKTYEKRRGVPKSWAAVLEIETEPAETSELFPPAGYQLQHDQTRYQQAGGFWSSDGDGEERPRARAEQEPPAPPSGARFASIGPSDFETARARIEKFYSAVGAGASMVSGNNGYGEVFDSYSRDLARQWITAAEADPRVRKIIVFFEAGGPVGNLILGHIILAGALVYVSGHAPALGFVYGKFDRFHADAHTRLLQERAEREAAEQQAESGYGHGAAGNGAAGAVADDPGAAGS